MARQLTASLKVLAALTALGTSSAMADDIYGLSNVGPTLWQGGYIGAYSGVGLGTAGSLSTGGTLIGLHGGYNVQAGQIVGSGEVDATSSQIKNTGTNESFDQKWMTSGRARAGYAFGNLLTYGTLGLAASAMTYTNVFSVDALTLGWVYGAGVEAMIMPHVALRGEVLRYEMGSASYLNSIGQSVSLDTQTNVFRFGIAYKF